MHPADLLATVQHEVIDRSGIDPGRGRPGGRRLCQPGRRAVVQHRPHRVAHRRSARCRSPRPPSTRSADPHSRPRTSPRASSAPSVVDIAVGCGVEVMSRVPIGSNSRATSVGPFRSPTSRSTSSRPSSKAPSASPRSGASAAHDADEFGLRLPAAGGTGVGRRAASTARSSPSTLPTSTTKASPPARPTPSRGTKGCGRPASRSWPPSSRWPDEDGVHTAGSSSQISDGAAAVLVMTAERAADPRAEPRRPGSSTPASSASTRC